MLGRVNGDAALTNRDETEGPKIASFDDGEIPADTYRPKIMVEEGGARGTNLHAKKSHVYGLGSKRATEL